LSKPHIGSFAGGFPPIQLALATTKICFVLASIFRKGCEELKDENILVLNLLKQKL
jgi:hypothetical protein